MSHLLDAWLDASRAGNVDLAAEIAVQSTKPYDRATSGGDFARAELKRRTKTVLVAEEKPLPVLVRVPELAPASIIPAGVLSPTAMLVGTEQKGGFMLPWTLGPASMMNEEWPIGSIIFYIGNSAAVTIGIYDRGDSLRDLLVSYLRRNVSLRVHTGIGRAGNQGRSARQDPPPNEPTPRTPSNSPRPRSGMPGFSPGMIPFYDEFQDLIRPFEEAKGLGEYGADAFNYAIDKYLVPWGSDFGNWLK